MMLRIAGWVILAMMVGATGQGADSAAAVCPPPAAEIEIALDSGPWMGLGGHDQFAKMQAPTGTLEQAIDQCVTLDMFANYTPGAGVAVILDGELIYERGYGIKRLGYPGNVDADTVFRIGSVTKQMTGAALMQQVESGAVELRTPVTEYIPEFAVAGPWSADSIEVWHLLTHTSGFPDRIIESGPVGVDALSQWATEQGDVPLHAPPGSFFNYSNPNFSLVALVTERASGVPYREYIEDQVWRPAGMTSTTFDASQVVAAGNYTHGHGRGITEPISPLDYDSWWAGPAGFAFSTAGDLAHWALLLTDGGGAVLAPETAAAMQGSYVRSYWGATQYYGFGIFTEDYRGLDLRHHGGNIAGWGTMLIWAPERRFAVAVLANTSAALSNAADCIVEAVLQPTGGFPDYLTDPGTWGGYPGVYDFLDVFGAAFEAEVTLLGQNLAVDFSGTSSIIAAGPSPLIQLYTNNFAADTNGDNYLDTILTFEGGSDTHGSRWLVNRMAVGERYSPRPRNGPDRIR